MAPSPQATHRTPKIHHTLGLTPGLTFSPPSRHLSRSHPRYPATPARQVGAKRNAERFKIAVCAQLLRVDDTARPDGGPQTT
jgi:hypothetical protein